MSVKATFLLDLDDLFHHPVKFQTVEKWGPIVNGLPELLEKLNTSIEKYKKQVEESKETQPSLLAESVEKGVQWSEKLKKQYLDYASKLKYDSFSDELQKTIRSGHFVALKILISAPICGSIRGRGEVFDDAAIYAGNHGFDEAAKMLFTLPDPEGYSLTSSYSVSELCEGGSSSDLKEFLKTNFPKAT